MFNLLKNKWEYVILPDVKDAVCVQINKGTYKGLVYSYGKVQFAGPPTEEGKLNVRFEYTIHKNPKDIKESPELVNFLGDLLVEIIERENG